MHYEHSPFKSILFCLAGYTLRKINRTYAIMVAYTMDTTAEKEKDRHISRLNGAVGFAFACGPRGGFFRRDKKRMGIFIRQFCLLLQCNFGQILFGVCPNVHTRSLVLLESDQKCSISQEMLKHLLYTSWVAWGSFVTYPQLVWLPPASLGFLGYGTVIWCRILAFRMQSRNYF